MFKLKAIALTLTMTAGIAAADHDRHDERRGDDHHDRGPVVRDHRNNEPQRVNRPGRANRRVISRGAVYANNGHFAFAGGNRVYVRPVIRTHYYNQRYRPQLLVENYSAEPGYIWVRGQWLWSGNEWRWGDGHYIADPQYSNYYDDGSYDYSVHVNIGG